MCRFPESVSHPFCSSSGAANLGKQLFRFSIQNCGSAWKQGASGQHTSCSASGRFYVAPHINAIQTIAGNNFQSQTHLRGSKTGSFAYLPDNGSDSVTLLTTLNPVKYDRQPTDKPTNQLPSDTCVLCKSPSLH